MKRFILSAIIVFALSSSGLCQTLDLTISSDKSVYKYGEAINITANIKNTGSSDVKIYSPAYWGVSDIVVVNSKGMTMNPAGLKIERAPFEDMMFIAPGESRSYVFENLMWFHCGGAWQFRDENLLPADTYTIFVKLTNPPQGDCSAVENLESTDFPGTLTSNSISVEILAALDEVSAVPIQVDPVKPALADVTPEGRKIERVFTLDDKVYSETDLFSDRYNGFYKTFHPNGQLATEVRYKDGWEIYDKAFDAQGAPVFRNGIVKEYYAGGNILASLGPYRNDLKNGEFKYYYYDGTTVVDIWHYMNGRRVGSHVRNDASGRLVSQEDWGYPTYYLRLWQYATISLGVLAFVLGFFLVANKKK